MTWTSSNHFPGSTVNEASPAIQQINNTFLDAKFISFSYAKSVVGMVLRNISPKRCAMLPRHVSVHLLRHPRKMDHHRS